MTGPSAAPAAVPLSEVHASPLARRMAKEKGLNLAEVHGTGPGGRIIRKDIEATIAARTIHSNSRTSTSCSSLRNGATGFNSGRTYSPAG